MASCTQMDIWPGSFQLLLPTPCPSGHCGHSSGMYTLSSISRLASVLYPNIRNLIWWICLGIFMGAHLQLASNRTDFSKVGSGTCSKERALRMAMGILNNVYIYKYMHVCFQVLPETQQLLVQYPECNAEQLCTLKASWKWLWQLAVSQDLFTLASEEFSRELSQTSDMRLKTPRRDSGLPLTFPEAKLSWLECIANHIDSPPSLAL